MNQIRKFVGNDMNEILDRIRDEMGRDAMIMKSSTISRFGSEKFEVIAAADEKTERQSEIRPFKPKALSPRMAVKNFLEEKSMLPVNPIPATQTFQSTETTEEKEKFSINDNLAGEIRDLRLLLNSYLPEEISSETESLKKMRSHLLNNNASRTECDIFIDQIKQILGERLNNLSFEKLMTFACALLEKKITKTLCNKTTEKRITALIGPTGSGKTTTIAKLAAKKVFGEKKQAILVSLDSYKIAAHDQLNKYAELMGIPFYTADTINNLKKIIESTPKETFIYIDTAGLSPMDKLGIRKATQILEKIDDCDITLTICAGNSNVLIAKTMENFRATGFNKVIITKIDEIDIFGHLLSLLKYKNENIVYLTNGQEVPKDIKSFSPRWLAKNILKVN